MILFFLFTLSTVICCGFFLLTNVLIVNRFGQKCLLNALNINVNFPHKITAGREHFQIQHQKSDLWAAIHCYISYIGVI